MAKNPPALPTLLEHMVQGITDSLRWTPHPASTPRPIFIFLLLKCLLGPSDLFSNPNLDIRLPQRPLTQFLRNWLETSCTKCIILSTGYLRATLLDRVQNKSGNKHIIYLERCRASTPEPIYIALMSKCSL